MDNFTLFAPHARLAFVHSQGNAEAAAEFNGKMLKVPGVKMKGTHFLVPHNAFEIVVELAQVHQMTVAASAWVVRPGEKLDWERVDEILRMAGEVRSFVLDGFLLPTQKEATSFGWSLLGVHIWHSTGAGKTLTGLLLSVSVEGPVVVVTRAASRTQYGREIQRFFNARPYILRPATKKPPLRVNGESYNHFRSRHKGSGLSRKEVDGLWEQAKTEFGVDGTQTLADYVLDCKGKGMRPFVVVGWESLSSNLAQLKAIRPGAVIFDESHRGKNTKRWDVVHLPDLPEDEKEALKQFQKDDADARAKGGFVKVIENEGRKMFLPLTNTASAAADLARVCQKRICTTATPVKDRVRDLWAQLDMAEPNAWGNSTSWRTRYCLDPSTRVLMGDGSYRPIGAIKEGDEVIGWDSSSGYRFLKRTRVVATSVRTAPVVQLRLVSGKRIVCTRDHHWLHTLAASSENPYKPVAVWKDWAQGNGSRGQWYRGLKGLIPLLHEPEENPYRLSTYKLGYIRGLLDGDGHMRIVDNAYEPHTDKGKKSRKEKYKTNSRPKGYQATIFSIERPHLERALAYAQELGLQTSGIKSRENPAGWTLGFYNRAAYRRLSISRGGTPTAAYKKGWLAGMYDAEGSGATISQYREVNPENYAFLVRWLREFGFDIAEDPKAVRIRGGKKELLRFFGLTRPALTRKLDAAFSRKPGFRFPGRVEPDRILSAVPLKGERVVVSIQTETGNYIAEGFGSKNCDMKPGVYGGMDDRGASNLDELKARLDTVAHIATYAQTHRHLPPKRRQSFYVAPEDQCPPSAGFPAELREAAKIGAGAVFECKLAQAASKKRKAVLGLIADHVASGHKVCVFTGRKRDCDELGKDVRALPEVKTANAPVWCAHGGQSQKKREDYVDEYMAHETAGVFIGTGDAFGESLNMDTTDVAMFVMLPYTPGQLRQWEGRFHRASTKRPVLVYYVVAEDTVDEHVAAILIDKLPSVEKVADDTELAEASSVLAGSDPNETEEQFVAAILESLDF